MKALVLNAPGRGFDVDEVDIASHRGREVLVDVQASGLCHPDVLVVTSFRPCSRDKEGHHESSGRNTPDQDHYDPLH